MAVIIDKSKEYGFILEVNPQFKLDEDNEIQCECKFVFTDIKTNEKVEDMEKRMPTFSERDGRYFIIISIAKTRKIYDAVYEQIKKTNIAVAKKIEKIKQSGQNLYLGITEEEYEALRKEREEGERRIKEELKEQFNENGITLDFYPESLYFDGELIYLHDQYILSSAKKNLLELLFGFDARDIINRTYRYCEGNSLFTVREEKTSYGGVDTVLKVKSVLLTPNLLNTVKLFLSEKEIKEKERRLNYLNSLLKDENKLLQHVFTDRVHVTEDGYFSDCGPYCDDCFWFTHVQKPYCDDNDVRRIAETFTVRSEKGKVYTYYKPSTAIFNILKNKYADDIKRTVEKIKSEIQKITKQSLHSKTGGK